VTVHTIGDPHPDLAATVEHARALIAAGDCPRHPGNHPIRCGHCRADRLASHDHQALAQYDRLRAVADCDDGFPERYRHALPDHPEVHSWIGEVVASPHDGPSLLLLGLTGRGKTWQAYGALRAVVHAHPGLHWEAAPYADFVASLRPRPGVDAETEMDRYRRAELLLLDDLGAAKGSEWVEEVTYRLVSHRYDGMRPTIYVTNLDPTQLRGTLGDRIASRLAETCHQVVLDGPDRRRSIRSVA
jgi:DNA replication protein DnaC